MSDSNDLDRTEEGLLAQLQEVRTQRQQTIRPEVVKIKSEMGALAVKLINLQTQCSTAGHKSSGGTCSRGGISTKRCDISDAEFQVHI